MESVKFVETKLVKNKFILTPNGYVPIVCVHKTEPLIEIEVTLINGETLRCAEKHVLIDEFNNEIHAINSLNVNIKTIHGIKKVVSVQHTGNTKPMYDLTLANTHVYYTNGFLSHNSGKSVSIGIYLTWLYTFKKDMNIGICANRGSLAREFLNNIREMAVLLPIWMQQGTKVWNKGTIGNENNMRILTDVPSSNSFRGFSCNVLVVDECIGPESIIYLRGSDKNIYIDKISRFYECYEDFSDFKIFTSEGFRKFDGIRKVTKDKGLRFNLQGNVQLECTEDHKFFVDGIFKYASDFVVGDELLYNCTLKRKITKITPIDTPQDYYDVINVDRIHHFTASGIEVSNCAFIAPSKWEEFADSFFPSQSALAWKKNIIVSTANGLNHYYKMVSGAQKHKILDGLEPKTEVKMEDGSIKTLKDVYKEYERTRRKNKKAVRQNG